MKRIQNKPIQSWKHQKGMTLIELLVAGVISLIAVSGMVAVMATTLGTTTQTIEMTRLTQDMRTSMQLITRELRRANYHPEFLKCYGNVACLSENALDTRILPVAVGTNVTAGDCVSFWYDRPDTDTDTDTVRTLVNDLEYIAAFRREVSDAGVGRIQMMTRKTSALANCTADTDWVDITDPEIIDVLSFVVDQDPSFPSIVENMNTAGDTQSISKLRLTMNAKQTVDASVPIWVQNQPGTRSLTEFVKVRNHVVTPAP
jgi:Tfp pilus assembly protein PilW